VILLPVTKRTVSKTSYGLYFSDRYEAPRILCYHVLYSLSSLIFFRTCIMVDMFVRKTSCMERATQDIRRIYLQGILDRTIKVAGRPIRPSCCGQRLMDRRCKSDYELVCMDFKVGCGGGVRLCAARPCMQNQTSGGQLSYEE